MAWAEVRERADACVARLPRWAWWAIGAAIACTGAITARLLADQLPANARVPVWLAGGGLIFIGLAVLSLGSRSQPPPADADAAAAAAGERAGDIVAVPPAAVAGSDPVTAEVAAAARMVDQLSAKESGQKPPDAPVTRQRLADGAAPVAGSLAAGSLATGSLAGDR